MSLYTDLLIQNGDVVLDAGHSPVITSDRSVIAQDIAHAIIESGLAFTLVADRGSGITADTISQLVLLVEDDLRVVPGTVKIEPRDGSQFWVLAQTYDFGAVQAPISTQV